MRAIYSINALLFMIIAANLALLGLDWLELGYGLNPLLAFPLAVISLVGFLHCGLVAIDDEQWL